MKWKWFILASFIVLCALVKQGVPMLPVVAGIAAVGLLNIIRNRKATAS
jgi:hypothetical protein